MSEIESTQQNSANGSLVHGNGSGGRGPGIGAYVGTVAVVGLGAALFETELLAGMALGVAAMAVPNLIPKLSNAFRPMLKSAVRMGYGVASRTLERAAEMGEQFQDVVAEVRAEQAEGIGREQAESGVAEPGSAAAGAEGHTEHGRGRKGGRSHASAGEA